MTQELQLQLDAAVLADATRILGTRTLAETVDRALELVLQVGETLRGVVVRPCVVEAVTGEEAEALSESRVVTPALVGYRERLLRALPRETRSGLPLRTALEAGGVDALLGEITCLRILLEKRVSGLAERDHRIECLEDTRLRLEERERQLTGRVEELRRRNGWLKRELGLCRER